jgi:carbon storage regulator CsrA
MLVLSRKEEEVVVVKHGEDVLKVKVKKCRNDKVGLGFDGPKNFVIVREELIKKEE